MVRLGGNSCGRYLNPDMVISVRVDGNFLIIVCVGDQTYEVRYASSSDLHVVLEKLTGITG